MAQMKVLYVILALLYTGFCASGAGVFYVRSKTSDTCLDNPCLTLSDYIHSTGEYFTSDTNFIFLEGEHDLSDLLVLDNITNLTLSGVTSKVSIVISAEAGVSCTNSQAIVMSSLMIKYRGKVKEGTHPALLFSNSQSVLIADVDLTGFSNAISFIQSTGRITNCAFISMEVPFTCLQVKSILLVPAYMQTTPSISEEQLYMLRIAHLPSMALTISWGMKLVFVVGLFMF